MNIRGWFLGNTILFCLLGGIIPTYSFASGNPPGNPQGTASMGLPGGQVPQSPGFTQTCRKGHTYTAAYGAPCTICLAQNNFNIWGYSAQDLLPYNYSLKCLVPRTFLKAQLNYVLSKFKYFSSDKKGIIWGKHIGPFELMNKEMLVELAEAFVLGIIRGSKRCQFNGLPVPDPHSGNIVAGNLIAQDGTAKDIVKTVIYEIVVTYGQELILNGGLKKLDSFFNKGHYEKFLQRWSFGLFNPSAKAGSRYMIRSGVESVYSFIRVLIHDPKVVRVRWRWSATGVFSSGARPDLGQRNDG